jgi:hypothetical protein
MMRAEPQAAASTRTLCVGERTLQITTNEPAVDEYLRFACARLERTAPGPQSSLDLLDRGSIEWQDGRAGLTFNGHRLNVNRLFKSALDAAVAGTAELLGQTFRRLTTRRAMYATGLTRRGVCLALVAPSKTGKTTLALELLRRGWSTYGDEFVLFDRETLLVEAVPLAFMVRQTALDVLGDSLLQRRIQRGSLVTETGGERTWHDVDVPAVFGDRALAEPRPLTHVILAERGDAGVALEKCPRAAMSIELLPSLFVENLQPKDIWETLQALQSVACYRLRLGDVRASADLLEGLDRVECTN